MTQLRNHGVEQCHECAMKSTSEREMRFVRRMQDAMLCNRRDKLRTVWRNMKDRCYNPKNKSYKYYGEKGVTVCKEWLEDFETFKEWAFANGYKDGLTIERNNIDDNYCPDNCRFITRREQTYNRTKSLFIVFEGKRIPVAELSYELGINNGQLEYFLRNYIDKKSL